MLCRVYPAKQKFLKLATCVLVITFMVLRFDIYQNPSQSPVQTRKEQQIISVKQNSANTSNNSFTASKGETSEQNKKHNVTKKLFQPPDLFQNDVRERVKLIKDQIFQTSKDRKSSENFAIEVLTSAKSSRLSVKHPKRIANNSAEQLVRYKENEPLIWVTGHPRSGTTLMRAMLDAHPDIRCGSETHVIPWMLGIHNNIFQNKTTGSSEKPNINEDIVDEALAAYIMTVIAQNGGIAKRLCNKDPLLMKDSRWIKHMFPNSKFIFMIRDGRAVVHSVMTRSVSILGFRKRHYEDALNSWNTFITLMLSDCLELGQDTCLPVYYEQLVLHPAKQMIKILKFLGVYWNDLVLRHHETVGIKDGVFLSDKELSTKQVKNAINTIPLTFWTKSFPKGETQFIKTVVPILEVLGYVPDENPPNYGEPDPIVLENTRKLTSRNLYDR